MRTEVHFKDVHRSDYAEGFINNKIDQLTEKLVQPDSDTHVSVRVEQDRLRTDDRHPSYQCEITLKSGMSSRLYKVKKRDRNFFKAVVSGFEALKVLLGKNHDRLRHDRRRQRQTAMERAVDTTPSLISADINV